MARKSKEERKAALRARTEGAVKNRDVSKYGGNDILDLSKSGKKGKVQMYKATAGKKKNVIDILPFIISEEWYKKLKTFNGKLVGLEPGDEEYKVEYAAHRNVGPENKTMLCLREMFGMPCEACTQRDSEFQKDEPDEKITDALKPTWRCLYNIYDYDEPEKDIQLWDHSRYLFEAQLLEEAENDDDGIILFSDIEEGKTLKFKGKEKTFGKKGSNSFVEVSSIDFEDRTAYEDSILDDTYPLDKMLIVPTVEEFTAEFLGLDTDGEGGDEDKPEPQTPRRENRRKPKFDKEEPKDNNSCPADYEFGVDCDKYPECETCPEDTFTKCAAIQDGDIEPEKTEPEPEPEPEKTRRPRRSAATEKKEEPEKRIRRPRR